MKNPYEHLRRDTRALLPQPWENYPTLRGGYEVIEVYTPKSGRGYINLLVAMQNGRWVCGMRYEVGSVCGGFLPGRKWGDFATRQGAILYTLGGLIEKFSAMADRESNTALRALVKAVCTHRATQLSLF